MLTYHLYTFGVALYELQDLCKDLERDLRRALYTQLEQRVVALKSSLHLAHGRSTFSGRVTLHLGFTCMQTGLKRVATDLPGLHAKRAKLCRVTHWPGS